MPAGTTMFLALRESLADLRAKVDGEPGHRIAQLGHAEGTIANLVRQILGAIADALAWLAGALRKATRVIDQADAVIALLEVGADLLDALADVIAVDLPRLLGISAGPLGAVHEGVHTGTEALRRVIGYLPSADDVHAIQVELDKLIGARGDPESKEGPGSLGRLLAEVSAP